MFLSLLLACSSPETPSFRDDKKAPRSQQAKHAASLLAEQTQAPPAFLTAPLPSPLPHAGNWPESTRPYALLSAQLCSGMQGPLKEALASHAKANPTGDNAELLLRYGRMTRYCNDPVFCQSMATAYEQASTAPDRHLLATFRVPCPESEDILTNAALPDPVILAWYADYSRKEVSPSGGRLSAAIQATPQDQDGNVSRALHGYGRYPHPGIAAELLALSKLPLSETRMKAVMGGLKNQTAPDAKAAHSAWCVGDKSELRACGKPSTPWVEEPIGEPTPEALRLVALGLARPGLYSTDPFVLAGYGAVSFDVETGMYPNEHHALLMALASRGDAAMQALLFLEIPPPEQGIEQVGPDLTRYGRPTSGSYTLLAWGHGKHWQAQASDLGDWYDLETVLGFLNNIALATGSQSIFVNLPTGDQTAVVLVGDRKAVATAISEGLIQPEGGGSSSAAGKAFEDMVIEQMLREGTP